jgi:hypothetical protein
MIALAAVGCKRLLDRVIPAPRPPAAVVPIGARHTGKLNVDINPKKIGIGHARDSSRSLGFYMQS